MIVCLCHRITESQIAGHVRAGCCSFEQLQGDLRVATGCGSCLDCARDTFEAAHGDCHCVGGHADAGQRDANRPRVLGTEHATR